MIEKRLFTSESVSEGHPDKICDQISDRILDAYLKSDKNSRVACETFITTEQVVVGGEVRSTATVDVETIVRDTLREIGYTDKSIGIGCDSCNILNLIHTQSSDISIGVDETDNKDIGAGDQGIMFGYATNETENYMPLAISIAHELVESATSHRKSGKFKHSRPDMKSQVTIDYSDINNKKIDTVLMSIQHDPDYNIDEFHKYVKENIIKPTCLKFGYDIKETKILINPTGRFVIGGPHGDAGLTGRKIIVDTYGGESRHGGGAFSGKDYTKVDRSGAYISRYIAKHIVASGLSDRCEIQLSYGIGISEPISIMVETFNTNKIEKEKIIKAIRECFGLSPTGIINTLNLKDPIYSKTSTYGHFGRDIFPWEKLNINILTRLKRCLNG